jgi:hypothetical protein
MLLDIANLIFSDDNRITLFSFVFISLQIEELVMSIRGVGCGFFLQFFGN